MYKVTRTLDIDFKTEKSSSAGSANLDGGFQPPRFQFRLPKPGLGFGHSKLDNVKIKYVASSKAGVAGMIW